MKNQNDFGASGASRGDGGPVRRTGRPAQAILPLLLTALLSVLLGALLLTPVRMIPSRLLFTRTAESAALNYTELRPELLPQVGVSQLDNYTDSLMLNLCLTESGSLLRDVLLNPYTEYGGDDPAASLRQLTTGAPGGEQVFYSRYWHGWQLFLRPMLLFANLSTIRYLLMSLELALTVLLIVRLARRGAGRVLPFLAFWLSLYPPGLFFSLQYAAIYCLTLLGCLGVLRVSDARRPLLFELLGIAVAYLDFLTYPLAALGVPLALYLSLSADRTNRLLPRLREALGLCVCWGLGYAVMWSGKWALAALLTGGDALRNSLSFAVFRIAGQVAQEHITPLAAIARNLSVFSYKGLLLTLLLLAAAAVWTLLRGERRRVSMADALGLMGCALMPFVWYALLANHSQIHAFFTFRALGVTVYALFSLLLLPLHTGGAAPDGDSTGIHVQKGTR